jgi:hypothetical protein
MSPPLATSNITAIISDDDNDDNNILTCLTTAKNPITSKH